MKLLKKFIAVFTFLFVFTVMALNMGVNAASLTYGSVAVNTTTYAGDTKVWDLSTNLPSTQVNMNAGDDLQGILCFSTPGSGKVAVKPASGYFDTYAGAIFMVPVPSSSSTGIVTRNGNNGDGRLLIFNGGSTELGGHGDVSKNTGDKTECVNNTKGLVSYEFNTYDIVTNPVISETTHNGYYLKFTVSGGELKTSNITVVLNDGTTTYGSVSVKHTMTYMDGSTELLVDSDAVEGSKVSYTPKKYGYDFEGWYTNASLDSQYKINTTTYTVTDDATLYANWTTWTNTGIETYRLTNSAIGKIATGIDGNLTANFELAPSIFTAMAGVGMTTTNVTLPNASLATQAACFNTNGAVTTSGYGLKFTAPTNGTLIVYIGAGGGSQRNVILTTDGTNSIDPVSGSLIVGNDELAPYTPVELVFNVNADTTYYLGGDNGVRIYHIEFSKASLTTGHAFGTSTVDGTKAVRFFGALSLEGITTSDITAVTATISISGSTKAASVKNILVTVDTSVGTMCTAQDDTLYFYTSVYGFEDDEFDDKIITVAFNVTFSDNSTCSKTTKYTINYAEM